MRAVKIIVLIRTYFKEIETAPLIDWYFARIREAMDVLSPVEKLSADGVLSTGKLSELESCVTAAR